MRIRWTQLALSDLEAIREYVSRDKPTVSARLAGRLRTAVERLTAHPVSGRRVPGFEQRGFREVIVRPYRIVYSIHAREIRILRVWHGRRDLGAVDS
jgi:toxin ParE1/3/4